MIPRKISSEFNIEMKLIFEFVSHLFLEKPSLSKGDSRRDYDPYDYHISSYKLSCWYWMTLWMVLRSEEVAIVGIVSIIMVILPLTTEFC